MSTKYTLAKDDMKKVGVGLLIAILGAAATYLMDTVPNIDFGTYTPIVVAINSVIVNLIRKYITTT